MLLNFDDPKSWEIGMRRLREKVDPSPCGLVDPQPAPLLSFLDFDLGRARALLLPMWFYEELRTLASEMAPFLEERLVGVEVRASDAMPPQIALAWLSDGTHLVLALPPRAPDPQEKAHRPTGWEGLTDNS